jgi:hypothetical protein
LTIVINYLILNSKIKLLKYNNQNKKEIENPNINLNPGNIDNQIKNFSSNNLASNGMFFYQLYDNNKIINNFIFSFS